MGKTEGIFLNLQCDCHRVASIFIKLRASKLKDHKIGRSPYFYETKSGDILRELFKVLPKTIGLRSDLCTVVLRRCLFFILAFTSQSDVVKPAMTMICHFYASRCALVLN